MSLSSARPFTPIMRSSTRRPARSAGLPSAVSCGDSGERGWRAELKLGGGKSLDDHHGPTTLGTEPERSGFLARTTFLTRMNRPCPNHPLWAQAVNSAQRIGLTG